MNILDLLRISFYSIQQETGVNTISPNRLGEPLVKLVDALQDEYYSEIMYDVNTLIDDIPLVDTSDKGMLPKVQTGMMYAGSASMPVPVWNGTKVVWSSLSVASKTSDGIMSKEQAKALEESKLQIAELISKRGISDEALRLLEVVLRNAIYEGGETSDITNLIEELKKGGSGSGSGGSGGGVCQWDESRIRDIEQEINSLILSVVKVSLSVSPTVVYKNQSVTLSFNATCSGSTPTSLTIKEDSSSGNQVATSSNNTSVFASKNFTITGNTKTFVVEAVINGNKVTESVNISARYPIFAGFGVTADDVSVSANKLSARTSASGTYTGTSTANGQRYFILVPSDITVPTTFVMGGSPFSMVKQATELTLGTVVYKVLRSGETYNNGTTLNIQVS